MNHHIKYGPAVVLAFFLAACVAHNPVTPNASTPAQKVVVYNAALAKANLAVATGAIELESNKILTVDQTGVLLNYNELVAHASESIRISLAQPGDWNSIKEQIRKTLDTVNVQKWVSSSGLIQPQVKTLLEAVSSAMAMISQEVSR